MRLKTYVFEILAIDILSYTFAFTAAMILRFHSDGFYNALFTGFNGIHIKFYFFMLIAYLAIFTYERINRKWRLGEDPLEQLAIVGSNHLKIYVIGLTWLYLIKRGTWISRYLLVMSFVLSFTLDVILRELLRVFSERSAIRSTNTANDEWNYVTEENKKSAKKKLLMFAHYYYPDVASTGQILKELAEGLKDTFDIYVICAVPSYSGEIESKYRKKKYYYEMIDDIKVLRVRVPEFRKARKASRIWNLAVYFINAIIASTKCGRVDYIFSISQPPILGGILGHLAKAINYKSHAKYIYNIQDFNPEQIEAAQYFGNSLILRFLRKIDCRSCRASDLVITVGRDLGETHKRRFAGREIPNYSIINNWIDENAIYPLPIDDNRVLEFKREHGLLNKFVIMYSGNIGLYYDLRNIFKSLEKFGNDTVSADGRQVAFAFVGNGSVLDELMVYKEHHQMQNVFFIPYQRKEDLIYSLNAADVHFCVNAKGIKGVSCPSKGYGIMAVGKPMIGVLENGAEIRCLIEEAECGICCEPEQYEELEGIIHSIIEMSDDCLAEMGMNGRKYLEKNLRREISIEKYRQAIMKL